MNKTECERKDCRFVEEGVSKTLMHSPVQYDSDQNPVGGGMNIVTKIRECLECGKKWKSRQTEFEDATGKERDWEEI